MRSLSRFREAFHDFPWTVHDFSWISTTFRVGRLRLLRSALNNLEHPADYFFGRRNPYFCMR